MTALFFNLLVNSAFSMACGLLVVGFFLWFFRIQIGPAKLFLLSLPFLKIVYDSVRGLPPESVLLAGLDPYTLPPKHQILQVGAGFSYWGPKLSVIFSTRDLNGKEYAASVGDYLVILPVTFSAEGDLLETTQAATSYVGVKKNFWVRVQKDKIQMSFDNITYKAISDVLGGSFEAGAGSDQNGGIANAINLTLKAYLK